MLKQYEMTFIVDARLSTEEVESVISKYNSVIESAGGNIKFLDRWGKRRLAYEIKKHQYGYYVYVRFEAEGTLIKELERLFKLDETVIRYLTVVLQKKALKEEKIPEQTTAENQFETNPKVDEAGERKEDLTVSDEADERKEDLTVSDEAGERKEDLTVSDETGEKEEDLTVPDIVEEKKEDLAGSEKLDEKKEDLDTAVDTKE